MSGRAHRWARASGWVIETEEGQRLEDWVAGYGALSLGHNPASLKAALQRALDGGAPGLYHEALNPFAGRLGQALVEVAGPGVETALLCNGGAEAIEAAFKLSILATGRAKIASFEGGFHGVSLGTLACMGKGAFREGFEGSLPPFVTLPMDEGGAAEAALAVGDIAAVVIEPIQVEAGARIVSEGLLRRLRAACDASGALLIFDEIQVGMGRTGSFFAFEQLGVRPDIVVLAKALGGGLVPVSAAISGAGLWARACGDLRRAEILSSTYGGGALACSVGIEAVAQLSDPALLGEVRRKAALLWGGLERALAGSPLVERISGRGLLGGIKLRESDHPWFSWDDLGMPSLSGQPVSAPMLIERLGREGILSQVCGHDWSVVRVEPPLIIDDEAIGRFIDAVADGIRWLESF